MNIASLSLFTVTIAKVKKFRILNSIPLLRRLGCRLFAKDQCDDHWPAMKVTLGAQGSCMMTRTRITIQAWTCKWCLIPSRTARIKCQFEGNNIQPGKNRHHQKAKTAGAIYSLEPLHFKLDHVGLHIKSIICWQPAVVPQTGVVRLELVAALGSSQ